MPIFNYKCCKCGHSFDLFSKVGGASEDKICSECGSSDIEKNYANFSFKVNAQEGTCGSGGCGTCGS